MSNHTVKNKLKYCKYTPKQFAQRIDYFCRRLENIQREFPNIDINMYKLSGELNYNTKSICGCVAGIYHLGHNYNNGVVLAKSSNSFVLGFHEILEFLGLEIKGTNNYTYFMIHNNLTNAWPYNGTLSPFATSEAYGIYNTNQLTMQIVIDTWKQFANNIRNTPESLFFNESMDLIQEKSV